MRLRFINNYYQGEFCTIREYIEQNSQAICQWQIASFLLLFSLSLLSCGRNSNQSLVIPPPTNPLIREFVGYGVVTASFAQVLDEPRQDGVSLAFLRRASLVRISERRILRNRGVSEIWVLVDAHSPEGMIKGWLGENTINVFDNEDQALTAARAMSP